MIKEQKNQRVPMSTQQEHPEEAKGDSSDGRPAPCARLGWAGTGRYYDNRYRKFQREHPTSH